MKNGWEKFKIIGISLLLLTNIFTIYRLNKIENQVRDFTYRMHSLEDLTNNISSDIYENITNALEKENSIINDFSYSFNAIKDDKISLNLKVLPKEYSPENEYYFSYLLKDGSSETVKANVNDGNYLVADINFPLKDEIELNYIEENKNGRRLEKLSSRDMAYSISNIQEELLQPFEREDGPFNMSFGSVTDEYKLIDETYTISYYFNSNLIQDDKGIENAEVYLYLGDKLIDKFPMKKDNEKSNLNREVYKYNFKDYKIDFKDKDAINIYAIANHSKGFKAKILIGNIYKESEDGDIHFDEPWEDIKTIVD